MGKKKKKCLPSSDAFVASSIVTFVSLICQPTANQSDHLSLTASDDRQCCIDQKQPDKVGHGCPLYVDLRYKKMDWYSSVIL